MPEITQASTQETSVPDVPEILYRAFRYRLEPTREQVGRLEHTREACRLLYNLAIEQRRWVLVQRPSYDVLKWHDQTRELTELRPFAQSEGGALALLDVPSIVCQDVLRRVDRAYQRWSRPDASGRRAGYPHYRRGDDYRSWTYATLGNGVSLRAPAVDDPVAQRRGPLLRLYAIGDLRVRWHRPLRGTIKTVSIVKELDGWFVMFTCAGVPLTPLPPTGKMAALDVRVASFATLDDGTELGHPHLYEQAMQHLALCQRRLDRRKPEPGQPPSAGYLEAKALLAKAHQRARRARAQFLYAAARQLVRDYDTLYHENLPIKALLELRDEDLPIGVQRARNRGMADAAWGTFFRILEAKARETGRHLRAVNPAYTTRTCSHCGAVLSEPIRSSIYACPSCGARSPKAVNAARNVLAAGRAADAATMPSPGGASNQHD